MRLAFLQLLLCIISRNRTQWNYLFSIDLKCIFYKSQQHYRKCGGFSLCFYKNQSDFANAHTLAEGSFFLNRNIFPYSCCTQQNCTRGLFFCFLLVWISVNSVNPCSGLPAASVLDLTCPYFNKSFTEWQGPCFGEREGSWYKSRICTLKGDFATCTVNHQD